MADVSGGESFTHENVPKVAPAVSALYLRPVAVWIWKMLNGALYLFIKGRPTTMGIKLIDRPIELGVAPAADI